jgi:hypothetical protein
VEAIYRDYEDKVYLAVTLDDDPGQELQRDLRRYLFFFPDEVERLDPPSPRAEADCDSETNEGSDIR